MRHEYYIQMGLDLAKKGWPNVAPNPMVGCVIVKNDMVVASGYHEYFGGPHAEVNAINNLPPNLKPEDCTLYVTLEPCSHFGKTPPCVDLLLNAGFKRVVAACADPNPKVSGRGIKKMQDAGIEVTVGVMEQKARELNKRFVSFFENKRPYFILKWAQTAEGFISRIMPIDCSHNKISGSETDKMVHKLRAEVMGIMVGKNTVLNDNPFLTTRLVAGKNPIRIFIDKQLEVPLTFNIYSKEAPTIVFNAQKNEQSGNIGFFKIDFNKNVLKEVSRKLFELNIQDVLVEGGKFLLEDFLNQHLWDEVLVFQNPDLAFDEGIKAPAFAIKNSFELVGNDKLFRQLRTKPLVGQ